MLKRTGLLLVVALLVLHTTNVFAFGLNPDEIRAAIAAALHSEDPQVKKAATIIQQAGLLKPGVGLPQIMAALKDPKVKRAAQLLQKKGILPNIPLPKGSKTQVKAPVSNTKTPTK